MESVGAALMPEPTKTLQARAWFLGTRIDVRDLERGGTIALGPLTMLIGHHGYSMIFRFGAVVLFGLTPAEESDLIRSLSASVHNPVTEPEREEVEIVVEPDRPERIDADGRLVLHEANIGRLQVVANVLAKSCVLAYYEKSVAEAFDRIEQLVDHLRQGVSPRRGKEVINVIGNALMILTRTVGRVEVTEKPEITWDQLDLDRLYGRLATEYELRDRDVALSRKLELVSDTAETYLDLVNHRQALRVEWYIVILIVVEIVLNLYDKFF
jgi:uncharacterized Rmd1/YagE family protein